MTVTPAVNIAHTCMYYSNTYISRDCGAGRVEYAEKFGTEKMITAKLYWILASLLTVVLVKICFSTDCHDGK